MKFTHIINPSKIDDPVARMFWEAVRSNFFELDRGVAKSIGGGNSPTAIGDGTTSHHALLDLTNFDDHSQYLYLAGRAGGQTIQSLDTSGAIATLTLKAKLNQTGAHWQCLDSNNVLMARIHGDGGFYCVSGATIKAGAAQVLSLERTGTSQNIQFLVSATPQVFIGGATELSFEHYVRAYRVTALNDNAGLVPLIVRGAVAQSQSLTQWQKDASTVVAKISKDGELSLLTTSTISIPLTIRTTTAGQLDNLTQWMDSVGTILASVNKDGKFVGDGSLLTSVPVGAHTHPETDIVDGTLLARVAANEAITGQWSFNSAATDNIPLIVKGFAGQTADLQRWTDSAGSILAKIDKLGNMTALVYNGDGSLLTNLPVQQAFPVGAVFISVVSTNPNTLLGYGTWSAFGTGRVLIGIDSGDTDFDVVEETGGAKTKASAGTISAPAISGSTAAEAAHTHSVTSNVTVDDHGSTLSKNAATGAATAKLDSPISHAVTNNAVTSGAGSSHSHAAGTLAASAPTFTGSATSVVQPYIVVYMWKRTV